ncbi:hypothetical protein LEP1GSC109_5045 [Leptospira interrogans str. UI 13372]|nr:hypothetical protein LEP1GSC109_5045 [Leptospira interrogans str. UI 13372]
MDLVYPSATRDQGSTEDNGLNMIQNFRACPKTYLQDILNKMIANAIWNNAV